MIDKGKYASHGAFINKIQQQFLPKWSKPKMAVINPIPSSKPRQRAQSNHDNMAVQSQTFKMKHKFQEEVKIKPIPSQLVQPFLYIQKVLKRSQKENQLKNEKLKPFVTSKVAKNKKATPPVNFPSGYASLYDYELDRQLTANRVFHRLLESDIDNIQDIFRLWNKDPQKKLTQDININEEEFIEFMRELIPSKISDKNLKHFFSLYKNPVPQKAENQPKSISIKALSHNYGKFKKAQTEISNIMSEKAMKERYCLMKKYIVDFLKEYPDLKKAMTGIKDYQEALRSHFRRCYDGYRNPFEKQIQSLQIQLQQPIIKYDKEKKQQLQNKMSEYEEQNNRLYTQLTHDYTSFMDVYEAAIVKNHDFFFTKRTVAKLLVPIIEKHPYITRDLIEAEIANKQSQKQEYLECLSDVVMEVDSDKKYIQEDCFTLGQIAEMVRMKFSKPHQKSAQLFTIESIKKLIKEIKRQFLLKNNLTVINIDEFPSDQEIPLQILHTCFEMECTKVLFKHQIWKELLEMIPQRTTHSKLHQVAIDGNTCMEYLRKYFTKLDQKLRIEVNKSKEISLLVENAHNQSFGTYYKIIKGVVDGVDSYVEGAEEQEQIVPPPKKKKVNFADIVDSKVQQQVEQPIEEGEETDIAKNLINMIHHESHRKQRVIQPKQQEEPPLNLSMLKTLAKSYFQPEAVNTNAFDIRFYEKINEEDKRQNPVVDELVKMGTSSLLQNVPRVDEIEGQSVDPLRISRFLLKNIDHQVCEAQKQVKIKQYEQGIGEGIGKSYYKEKIKLENKPTKYDSEGKSKYSVLLPVGYYESYIVGENIPHDQKWYLRPHHVETLTENPLSKKDNVIHTEYKSKLQKIPLKKRPQEFEIEANVKRKQELINSLQDRVSQLKAEITNAKRQTDREGAKVSPHLMDQYYKNVTADKEDKELQMGVYDGILYDLRRKERQLLNAFRDKESGEVGEPSQKWWERKDKQFHHELKKDRNLMFDEVKGDGKHKQYVEKLKNSEIY